MTAERALSRMAVLRSGLTTSIHRKGAVKKVMAAGGMTDATLAETSCLSTGPTSVTVRADAQMIPSIKKKMRNGEGVPGTFAGCELMNEIVREPGNHTAVREWRCATIYHYASS